MAFQRPMAQTIWLGSGHLVKMIMLLSMGGRVKVLQEKWWRKTGSRVAMTAKKLRFDALLFCGLLVPSMANCNIALA